jgi:hypothetical protein
LQPFRIQSPDAAKDFIKKTGFGFDGWHEPELRFNSGKMAQCLNSSS